MKNNGITMKIKQSIWKYFFEPLMSISIRNRFVLFRNNVQYSKLNINGKICIVNYGKIFLGNGVVINSSKKSNSLGFEHTTIEVFKNAELIIKDNVGLSNAVIRCQDKIVIEKNVLIGGGTILIDSDSHSVDWKIRVETPEKGIISAPITIKYNSFIGTGCVILKGVTIGEKSVIGAGSVVTKSIPAGEMWGGNPARFIKKIV